MQPPDHFLLIEPDEALRRILTAEIEQGVTFPVQSCGLQDCPKMADGAIPVVLPNPAAAVRQTLVLFASLRTSFLLEYTAVRLEDITMACNQFSPVWQSQVLANFSEKILPVFLDLRNHSVAFLAE